MVTLIKKIGELTNSNGTFDICFVDTPFGTATATCDGEDYDIYATSDSIEQTYAHAAEFAGHCDELILM